MIENQVGHEFATVDQLIDSREAINNELRDRALAQLKQAARLYSVAYGVDKGIYELGEHLCRIVATEEVGVDGWPNLLTHLRKISG